MSTIPTKNSITELRKFVENVLNAFDIYETYAALLHYSFGPRKLIEVVRTSVQDKSQREEVGEIVNRLAEYANNELIMMTKELNRQNPIEIKERIALAWEVFKIYEEFFPENKNLNYIELLFHNLNVNYAKGELMKTAVPDEVLVHFGENPVKPKFQVPLSRDDSFYNVPIIKGQPCAFVRNMIEALDILKLTSPTPWINIATASFCSIMPIDKVNSMDALEIIFDNEDILFTEELQSYTLDILEKVLDNCEQDCRRTILHEAQEKMLAGQRIPDYSSKIKNFQERLSNAINGLGSHNSAQDNKAEFEKLRNELRFLLLVSPKLSIQSLINHCLQNKDYTPGVLKVLRGFQASCNAIVQHENKECPLMISIIDKVFKLQVNRLNNDTVDNFAYVITSFCRKKLTVIKAKGEEGRQLRAALGEVVEESILEPSDVICHFCLPKMFKKGGSDIELRFILTVLKKIITSIGSKNCELRYSFNMKEENPANTIHVHALFKLIHELLVQHESQDTQVPSLCFAILKGLAAKLKEDDIIFPEENAKFFLENLCKDAWWFRYAITEWYAHSLNNPIKQVPSGLYYALPEAIREKCAEIRVDFESAPVGCLLYSLFELGIFDPELALNILSHGLDALPLDDLLFDQIALALCDCCANPFFGQRVSAIIPVINRMVEIFDPRTAVPYVLDQVNDNILSAVRQMKAIQVVARAAKMAYLKGFHYDSEFISYYPSVSKNKPKNPKEVAENLLQTFCEVSKAQITSNIELSRILLKKSDRGDKQSSREYQKLEEQLFTQLVLVFHESVMFSKLNPNNKSLEVLIKTLADYILEVQGNQSKVPLDNIKIPYRKTEYGYAKNSSRPTSPQMEEQASEVTKKHDPPPRYRDPQYSHPSQRNTSGYPLRSSRSDKSNGRSNYNENRIKGRGYMESMKAVSNQIGHDQTRQQVQRKLDSSSRNSPPLRENNRFNKHQERFQSKPRGGIHDRRGGYQDRPKREFRSKPYEEAQDKNKEDSQNKPPEYKPRANYGCRGGGGDTRRNYRSLNSNQSRQTFPAK